MHVFQRVKSRINITICFITRLDHMPGTGRSSASLHRCEHFMSEILTVYPALKLVTSCCSQQFILYKGLFTLEPRSEFNAHWINPPLEVDWNWIWIEFIVYSSNNIKLCMVMPIWTAKLSKLLHLGHTIHAILAVQDTNYNDLSSWDATD